MMPAFAAAWAAFSQVANVAVGSDFGDLWPVRQHASKH
jgi:hypothetical protein